MYDYPNIHRWLKTVYQYKNIGEAVVDFPHVKKLYYGNVSQNPSQRVPLGPFVDYRAFGSIRNWMTARLFGVDSWTLCTQRRSSKLFRINTQKVLAIVV